MVTPALMSAERVELYQRLGYWTGETLAEHADRNAAAMPRAAALSDENHSLTWKDVKRWSDAVACGLIRQGLPRDAIAATWLPNWIEHYLIRIACEKAGLIWLPVPRAARQHELLPILRRSGASALVLAESERRDYWGELQEVLPHLPHAPLLCLARGHPRAGVSLLDTMAGDSRPSSGDLSSLRGRSFTPLDVAMILPTSGSTGTPKLCEYLLAGAVARGRAQAELFHLTAQDVIVAATQGIGPSIIPLFAAPVVGASVVILERPEPARLAGAIEQRRATVVCGVPTIYRDLVELLGRRYADMSSVRIWYSAGARMPVELARRLEEQSRGVVLSGYGAVDLGCWAAPAPEDPPDVRWFTVGKPRGGSELRIAAGGEREGEIWGRGPSSTVGYYLDRQATKDAWTEDGWFRTGDIGRFDERSNLIILGRTVEVIKRGGQKIFPTEIELLLERHPGIARVAVVPFPDERLGEKVCACVVAADSGGITLDDVVSFLRGFQVASYKLPERLIVVADLPLTSGGKVDRDALRTSVARNSGVKM